MTEGFKANRTLDAIATRRVTCGEIVFLSRWGSQLFPVSQGLQFVYDF
jgi:hypothetical protein